MTNLKQQSMLPEDAPGYALRQQFKQLDTRPVQHLNQIITVDDLRKQNLLSSRDDSTSLQLNSPVSKACTRQRRCSGGDAGAPPTPTRGASATSTGGDYGSKPWDAAGGKPRTPGGGAEHLSALESARQQLQAERPEIFKRMEKITEHCNIMRANRNFRLNTLGVFSHDVNEVRSRSMQRVEVYKEMSTTSMRMPPTDKALRPVGVTDTVQSRLERMFTKVLKSVDEQASHHHRVTIGGFGKARNVVTAVRRISHYGNQPIHSGPGQQQQQQQQLQQQQARQPQHSQFGGYAGPKMSTWGGTVSGAGGGGGGGGHSASQLVGLPANMSMFGGPPAASTAQPGNAAAAAGAAAAGAAAAGAAAAAGPVQPLQTAWRTAAGAAAAMVAIGSPLQQQQHPQIQSETPTLVTMASNTTVGSFGRRASFGLRRHLSRNASRRMLARLASSKSHADSFTARGTLTSKVSAPGPPVAAKVDWSKVSLPPEVIEEQLRQLARATTLGVAKYHARVAAARGELLEREGLGRDALETMTPAELEAGLMEQAKQDRMLLHISSPRSSTVEKEPAAEGGEDESPLKAASQQLGGAKSLEELIRAALLHVQVMEEEYERIVEELHPQERQGRHHRKKKKQAPGKKTPTFGALPAATSMAPPGKVMLGQIGRGKSVRICTDQDEEDEDDEGSTSDGDDSSDWGSSYSGSVSDDSDDSLLRSIKAQSRQSSPKSKASSTRSRRQGRGPKRLGGTSSLQSMPTMARRDGGMMLRPARSLRARSMAELVDLLPPELFDETPINPEELTLERMEALAQSLDEAAADPTGRAPPEVEPLPPLRGGPSLSVLLQARMARIWEILQMPLTPRLDFVLRFTKPEMALRFEPAIVDFEAASAAVLCREAIIAQLLTAQHAVEAEDDSIRDVSLPDLEARCIALMRVTRYIELLGARLEDDWGCGLTYQGQPYPGEGAIGTDQLLLFMQNVRDAVLNRPLKTTGADVGATQ